MVGSFKSAQAQTGGAAFSAKLGEAKSSMTAGGNLGGAQMIMSASSSNRMASAQTGGGAAFGAGAGALPGMDGSTGGNVGGAALGSAAGSSNPIGAAAGGNSQDQLLNATKSMQETQMSFNLQYLQLQSQMQHENRSYTAISNIMKTKHDTVKNSISNVR
jgi:hypothetical protein